MGKRQRDKGRIEGPFTPLLHATMDTPAWRQLSHGAARIYLSLKRRVPKHRNVAWLSIRDARREVKASPRKIQEWFAELQHYGFIVLHSHGCLGVNGKGKAPMYRLTELGQTRAASAGDEFEPPTRDYLQWDGTVFQPRRRTNTAVPAKKQNPVTHVGNAVCTTWVTPVCTTWVTPKR